MRRRCKCFFAAIFVANMCPKFSKFHANCCFRPHSLKNNIRRNVAAAHKKTAENVAEAPMQSEKAAIERASRRLDRMPTKCSSMRSRGGSAETLNYKRLACERLNRSNVCNGLGANLKIKQKNSSCYSAELFSCDVYLLQQRQGALICDRF